MRRGNLIDRLIGCHGETNGWRERLVVNTGGKKKKRVGLEKRRTDVRHAVSRDTKQLQASMRASQTHDHQEQKTATKRLTSRCQVRVKCGHRSASAAPAEKTADVCFGEQTASVRPQLTGLQRFLHGAGRLKRPSCDCLWTDGRTDGHRNCPSQTAVWNSSLQASHVEGQHADGCSQRHNAELRYPRGQKQKR